MKNNFGETKINQFHTNGGRTNVFSTYHGWEHDHQVCVITRNHLSFVELIEIIPCLESLEVLDLWKLRSFY